MLATVAHDLKNPLNTITLAVGFLLEEVVPVDEAHAVERRHLQMVMRAAGRMRRLVGDLLDTSALASGSLRLATGPCPVAALLDDARDALAPLAAAKGIALIIDEPREDLVVHADRGRVLQVFANLGDNAIKFTPSGGRVVLSAARGTDAVDFAVADSGPGISPHELPCVFDRFWQSQGGSRLGTGLGLAIAQGIVHAHGGAITTSSVVGEGSTFRFSIPLVPQGPVRDVTH